MPAASRLGRAGAFWTSASVLALVLWSSAAPSVLYPLYAQKWELSPALITLVFAAYQVALIVTLPLFGNLSDQFGRRLVMLWGVVMIAASAVASPSLRTSRSCLSDACSRARVPGWRWGPQRRPW